MNIKKELYKFSKDFIDIIGITDSRKLDIENRILDSKNLGFFSKFYSYENNIRMESKFHLESCESIIVIGESYKIYKNNKKLNTPQNSSMVLNKDYHLVIQEKLNKIVNFLEKFYDDLEYKICVDTCNLDDRMLAYKAGLGRFGKNNQIISEKYGSSINIGYILINKKLECDEISNSKCDKNCNICVKACPSGALKLSGEFDATKCISELTQIKRILTYKEREIIGNKIYGCDICQRVCPENKVINDDVMNDIQLLEFIKLSNREFKEKFSDRAFSWRGNNTLKRNALIVIGNSQNKDYFDNILPFLKHQSDDIKIYVLWTLYKLDAIKFKNIVLKNELLQVERQNILEYYNIYFYLK